MIFKGLYRPRILLVLTIAFFISTCVFAFFWWVNFRALSSWNSYETRSVLDRIEDFDQRAAAADKAAEQSRDQAWEVALPYRDDYLKAADQYAKLSEDFRQQALSYRKLLP